MSEPYAVFIGDVALDEFFRPSQWPVTGTKIDLFPVATEVGGMIANAAAVYAGFGEQTRFLWAMNDGALTQQLLTDLEAQGIDIGLVIRNPELADSRNIIILTDGEHTVMTPALGLATIDLDDAAIAALQSARYVYTAIGDLRCLRHQDQTAATVMQTIRTGGARIVLDLDVANVQPGDDALIAQADIVLFNRIGFERYCAGRSSETVISGLLSGAAEIVVVTLGADGCRVATTDDTFDVAGVAIEVVDVTGAGDTFGAAFIHALNLTSDLRAAAAFANAAAARAVTTLGARAGVATETDVVSFLHHHGLPLGSFPGSEGQAAASTANERSVS